MRNYGQHNALLCGIRQAHFEFLVTMDDDLQHDPADIAPLLERLREGFDVVYGPPVDAKHSFLRNLASQLTKLALQGAMGGGIARHVSAFRILRTGIRRAFHHFHGPQANIDVMLTWGTRRFSAVPVPHHPRAVGASNYTVGKLIAHAMNMITGFTALPLQIASLLGFGFMLFGAALLMWIVGMWLFVGQAPAGFAFLGSSIAIFSGVQLFCLGIIGEYLAPTHFRIMERPTYTVGEIAERPEAPPRRTGLSGINAQLPGRRVWGPPGESKDVRNQRG